MNSTTGNSAGTRATAPSDPAGTSPAAVPPPPPATAAVSAARAVTDALQPRNILLAGMLGVGLAAAGHWTGLLWGFLGALCAGIVPAGYIEWERKRGTWGDRHVVDRTKRAPIFFVILGSVGVGSLVMVLGHAPEGILLAMLALWAMTIVLLSVNTVWKISVDSAVASAVVALLAVVHSPWWLAAGTLTVAVCWSRVALRYHSVAQVVAGAALGAATTVAYAFG
ncbi:hypothetical protein ACIGJO_09955 [Streptomyces sp. NPDC079020]|uniref:hypothetical protein n=1 Tax=Streptomyces sp. NPDC079020 TaxID=3365722 RepID=UPI0037D328AB